MLIAEHADRLAGEGGFLFPRAEPELPRRLASKQGLHELCAKHGVPTPEGAFPDTYADVKAFAASTRFPVVAKNREAFERRKKPAVGGTSRTEGPRELKELGPCLRGSDGELARADARGHAAQVHTGRLEHRRTAARAHPAGLLPCDGRPAP
ncbi:hypothetical protein GCM10010390_11090 [Streptomyces mordarskii]|uniref:ATP-grasp domain-containing protein n=1 Tax=Streptomyces mordarskii TaxID=1226758 RepID=A0ABN1C2F3_9ACTN